MTASSMAETGAVFALLALGFLLIWWFVSRQGRILEAMPSSAFTATFGVWDGTIGPALRRASEQRMRAAKPTARTAPAECAELAEPDELAEPLEPDVWGRVAYGKTGAWNEPSRPVAREEVVAPPECDMPAFAMYPSPKDEQALLRAIELAIGGFKPDKFAGHNIPTDLEPTKKSARKGMYYGFRMVDMGYRPVESNPIFEAFLEDEGRVFVSDSVKRQGETVMVFGHFVAQKAYQKG